MRPCSGPAPRSCKSTPGDDVPDPAPLDAANQPPIDRYCDLVLTGGVTDGVIYPWAILELARFYRFKNIGGTSVGAMAAALTAAAEYARRQGFLSGFNELLLQVPRKLAEDVKGRTRIFTLFQPASSNQRLFDLFVALSRAGGPTTGPTPESSATATSESTTSNAKGKPSTKARQTGNSSIQFASLVRQVLCTYRRPALLGFACGLSLAVIGAGCLLFSFPGSTLTWSVLQVITVPIIAIAFLLLSLAGVLVFVLAFILLEFYRDLVNGLVPNGFGLCTGGHGTGVPNDEPSLVEWLHDGIQAAARKTARSPADLQGSVGRSRRTDSGCRARGN